LAKEKYNHTSNISAVNGIQQKSMEKHLSKSTIFWQVQEIWLNLGSNFENRAKLSNFESKMSKTEEIFDGF